MAFENAHGFSLDAGGSDVWVWDPAQYESTAGVIRVLDRLGRDPRPYEPNVIMFEVTRYLIADTLEAAAGVELAYGRLHDAMKRGTEVCVGWGIEGDANIGVVHETLEEAWYALEELITWARTLDDRLSRKAVKSGFDKQGLIPALVGGPRKQAIVEARNRLLGSGVQEARFLSGLGLHVQSTQAGTKVGRFEHGKLILLFPDRVMDKIDHRCELTYAERRGGVDFADRLMDGVERFMHEFLRALEDHLPERFKPQADQDQAAVALSLDLGRSGTGH